MSRKKKNSVSPQQKAASAGAGGGAARIAEDVLPGKKARLLMALGLALIAAGYVLLKKADPAGRNIYAALSPFFLLAGYLLIPAALYARDGSGAPRPEREKTGPPGR